MISLLLSLALLLSGSSESISPQSPPLCSCVGEKSFDEQFAEANLIFEGVAVKKFSYPLEELERLDVEVRRKIGFGDSEYVLFYAMEIWKGSRIRDLVVSTPKQESMCGYDFEEGERYVVYAYVEESQPMTHICTLTKPAAEAQEDREKLNAAFEK